MTVSIRNATRVDVPSVMALWEEAAENDARPADSSDAVETLLARDSQALMIAEMDGRIVGSIIAGWDGWRAHLYRLAVHPEARRRGIGRQLLVAATERLTDLGATRLDAMVLEGNELWTGDMAFRRFRFPEGVAALGPAGSGWFEFSGPHTSTVKPRSRSHAACPSQAQFSTGDSRRRMLMLCGGTPSSPSRWVTSR